MKNTHARGPSSVSRFVLGKPVPVPCLGKEFHVQVTNVFIELLTKEEMEKLLRNY